MSGNTEPAKKKQKVPDEEEKKKSENSDIESLKLPDLDTIIIFLTGNKGKLQEVQNYVGNEISKCIINYKIDLDEIQGNEIEILTNKLLNAQNIISKQLSNNLNKQNIYILVEDTSLALGLYSNNKYNFPGPFCKFLLKSSGCNGYINMVKNHDNKSCTAICTFGLLKIDKNNNKPLFCRGECKGNVANKVRGTNGFGWDGIFEYIGNNKTFAEMTTDEKNKISHRANALKKLTQYLTNNVFKK
eukprot:552190_1